MTRTDSLAVILDNINETQNNGVRIGIGCMVTAENIGEMEKLAALHGIQEQSLSATLLS